MDTATRLLNAAEARMRETGYHAVSFRDLAADLGIKSASVHYYFPKKEELGVAVIDRYRRQFIEGLTAALGPVASPAERLEAVAAAFRAALVESDKICLCGVMGAEAQGLPEPVRVELKRFIAEVVDLIQGIYREAGASDPYAQALLTVAALEGGMILAVNLEDLSAFDRIVAALLGEGSAH